jgi:hypothetical protein
VVPFLASKAKEKDKTWRLMRILKNQYDMAWLCLGDFNEILFESEKVGGRRKAQSSIEKFRHALEDCGLDDLGFVGDAFTWRNHHHQAEGYIKQRLDRAVGVL